MEPCTRFLEKVVSQGDCLVWVGTRDRAGYGRFRLYDKKVKAYRFAYESARGPIPADLEIDHLCRNRGCVNVNHLEVVTHQENMSRGHWANTTHCPQGHPYDESNTRVTSQGSRICCICHRSANRRFAEKEKLAHG